MKKGQLHLLGFIMALSTSFQANAKMTEFLRSSQETLRSEAPVAGKKTVCTITLNSSDEKDLFQKKLNPDQFQFVELTLVDQWAPQTDSRKGWFDRACDSKVQCDMLIISGHFGGIFFGTSGKSLSFEELENRSCRKTCNGILSNPKEVFLFGCNTLAAKEKDSRSPEQYVEVLMAERDEMGQPIYSTRAEAEAFAQDRYGATGEANRDRMSRVFLNVPYIYGFKTKAPLGYAIAPYLAKYIDAALPYEKHLNDIATSNKTAVTVQNELLNVNLQNIPHKGLFQCAGLSGLNQNDEYYEVNVNMCKFYNLITSDTEKIKFVFKLLRQTNKPKLYLPPVIDLLGKNAALVNSSAANALKSSPEIKALFVDTLNDILSPVMKSQWIVIGKKMTWLSDAEYQTAALELYKKLFNNKINNETASAMCSLDFNTAGNPTVNLNEVATLVRAEHFATAAAIQTVYCSKVLQNENVIALLESAVQDGMNGKNKNLAALIGILDMKGLTLNPKIKGILSQVIPVCLTNDDLVSSCIAAFSNLDAKNSSILDLAYKAVSEKSPIMPIALKFLTKTNNKYSGNEMDIANQLKGLNGNLLRVYGEYFAQFPPTTNEAKGLIVDKSIENLYYAYELVRSLITIELPSDKYISLVQIQQMGKNTIYDTWSTIFAISSSQNHFTVSMAQELFKKPVSMGGLPIIAQNLKKLMDNVSFQDAILQDTTALKNLCDSAADTRTVGAENTWDCFDKIITWKSAKTSVAAKEVASQMRSQAATKFLSKIK